MFNGFMNIVTNLSLVIGEDCLIDSVLIFVVQIKSANGNASFAGNVGNGRILVAVLIKKLLGRRI